MRQTIIINGKGWDVEATGRILRFGYVEATVSRVNDSGKIVRREVPILKNNIFDADAYEGVDFLP